jgi:hypothetical protein
MTTIKPKRLLYKRATAAHMLDESVSSLIRMEEEGRLTPVILRPNGVVHYRAEEVEALAKPRSDIKRKKAPQPKPLGKIQPRRLGRQ